MKTKEIALLLTMFGVTMLAGVAAEASYEDPCTRGLTVSPAPPCIREDHYNEVPVPATGFLLGVGALYLLYRQRRK